ncbi:vitamin K epoxide reductase family protein [Nocardia sp. NPDC051787]|uniref:vitamin K epoxide reductase family protein n=1 Tax=Nocardia sp. NPDC051787 TaxID=3155415 RepID=UPI0034304E55
MPSTTRCADSPTEEASAAEPDRPEHPFSRTLPWILLIGGIVGAVASFVLTVEKFTLATDSSYIPSCSVSPVLNCGSVMATPQAEVFGFPNSLLGIAGFAVVATIGAALLANARFRQWFWHSLQLGVTAAVVFVHWLITQSLYSIGALCPYCMIVWAVTVPIFWYVTLRNLGQLRSSKRPAILAVVLANHSVPLTFWALTIIGLITHRFWWYWSGLL